MRTASNAAAFGRFATNQAGAVAALLFDIADLHPWWGNQNGAARDLMETPVELPA
jgi:hypothetical protein